MEPEKLEKLEAQLTSLVDSSRKTAKACRSLRTITLWVWVVIPIIVGALFVLATSGALSS